MATPAEVIDSAPNAGRSVAIGESYEVAIEKLVYGGDGLAHIGSQAVFAPLAAPGDFARIRIVECERNYARGVIEELLDPSPLRRTPPCQYFGVCGGCQLQHLDYPAQLEAKASFVRESLRRIGAIEWDKEIHVRSSEEFGYRSRAEIKVARDENGRARIGYFRAGSREVCEIESCPILTP
ncbi:MAG TPA: TRAM domain-containing protein, partial [Blastocatellia bacterium]|nr:TRAM domain-containing protein [Blastocatellia bacterium]